jgi:hypothetical protein
VVDAYLEYPGSVLEYYVIGGSVISLLERMKYKVIKIWAEGLDGGD